MLVELVSRYPYVYNDQMMEALEPLTPRLHAHFFFAMGNRYAAGDDMEAANFWTFLGRYRLRYDALRCDYMAGDVVSDKYVSFYSLPPLRDQLLQMGDAERRELLTEVLAWDAENPAANDPRYFCEFIEDTERQRNIGIIPKSQWDTIRLFMRAAAQKYIDELNNEDLTDLEKLLDIDDTNLYNFFNGLETDFKFYDNKINLMFKNFKFSGQE